MVYLVQARIRHALRNNLTHQYNGQEYVSTVSCCVAADLLVPDADELQIHKKSEGLLDCVSQLRIF